MDGVGFIARLERLLRRLPIHQLDGSTAAVSPQGPKVLRSFILFPSLLVECISRHSHVHEGLIKNASN